MRSTVTIDLALGIDLILLTHNIIWLFYNVVPTSNCSTQELERNRLIF